MGKNWAITIGINKYNNLQSLQFAKRDAELVREFFQKEIEFEKIYHFTDDSPPIRQDHGPDLESRPTFATLRRFLRVRFEQEFLRTGDNLWFFFAGHGVRHEDRDYLMPCDADPGDVESTAIPLNYVTERLRRSGADNVILFVDACRSQTRSGLGVGEEHQKGVITLFACSPKETSYEIEDSNVQQGAFTYVLLQGLRVQGAGNCATVERLNHYLRNEVPKLNQHYGKPRQTPYCKVEPLAKSHLILLPKQATLSDIKALKFEASQAELRLEYLLAKQLWIRVLSASSTDSDADSDAIEGIGRLAQAELVSSTLFPADKTAEPSLKDDLPLTPVAPQPKKIKPGYPSFEYETISVNDRGTITHRQRCKAEFQSIELGNGTTLELVKIPGGTFTMGSPTNELERVDREGPQHKVTVPSFFLGKYQVTQTQWEAIMESNPSRFKGANRPVEQVSWNEAVEFCQKLSQKSGKKYRLPSEAEWEYACRARTTTPFYFGETITPKIANYDGTSTYSSGPKGEYRKQTTEVGTFPPNAFGLYDMHGNVWEWCQDHWHYNYKGAPTNGSAWINENDNVSPRIRRGGSWFFDPRLCCSAYRLGSDPESRNYDIGFRVVCSVPSLNFSQAVLKSPKKLQSSVDLFLNQCRKVP